MQKQSLVERLEQARKRLHEQEELVKTSLSNVDYAVKNGFTAFERESRGEHKRRSAGLAHLKALVLELEKASGALPLK